MDSSGIARTAARLRAGIGIVWIVLILVYVAGRLGTSLGVVRVQSQTSFGQGAASLLVADASVILLSVALYQLNRMLGAISGGDLFSARVVQAFRAFAFWLLLLSLAWIVAPALAVLLSGPDDAQTFSFKFQLRDLLTVGITLILFLVARLLERARALDEEMREIV